MDEFTLDVVHGGDATEVTVVGEVDLASAPQLRTELAQLTGSVVVDLAGVTFMDSVGISVLMLTQRRLVESGGGSLVLRAPQDHVRRVIELVGLRSLLEHDPSATGLLGERD
jgi:anti-anti-sigma factor